MNVAVHPAHDFRISWERPAPGERLAWCVEVRGLNLKVVHLESYSEAVRLAERAVAEHYETKRLRESGVFVAHTSSRA
jgi:hypothetical protein